VHGSCDQAGDSALGAVYEAGHRREGSSRQGRPSGSDARGSPRPDPGGTAPNSTATRTRTAAGPGAARAGQGADGTPLRTAPVQPMATPRRPPPGPHPWRSPSWRRTPAQPRCPADPGRPKLPVPGTLDEAPLPARGEPGAGDRRCGPRSHRRRPCLVERDLRAPDVAAAFCLDELPAKRSSGPPPQASSVCLTRPRYHHPLMRVL
jgi:hypothetical protein